MEKNIKHAHWHKYTRKKRHNTTYFIPYYRARRQICKAQLLHYFNISRRVAESLAKDKADVAVATPLSPMKRPQKKATDNTRRASAIKLKFEKFLQGLPQADNRFSDANWRHTETVHLAPAGGRRASPYNVDPLAAKAGARSVCDYIRVQRDHCVAPGPADQTTQCGPHSLWAKPLKKNVTTYAPPNPYISEMAFFHRFQKVKEKIKKYTHTPPQGTKFWHIGPKIHKPRKSAKTHRVGA